VRLDKFTFTVLRCHCDVIRYFLCYFYFTFSLLYEEDSIQADGALDATTRGHVRKQVCSRKAALSPKIFLSQGHHWLAYTSSTAFFSALQKFVDYHRNLAQELIFTAFDYFSWISECLELFPFLAWCCSEFSLCEVKFGIFLYRILLPLKIHNLEPFYVSVKFCDKAVFFITSISLHSVHSPRCTSHAHDVTGVYSTSLFRFLRYTSPYNSNSRN
jgi:hypothetical protein